MKIFNDDVICKHGATIGSLNEEEIFYLCARGLERKNAINLILDGHISSYIWEKGVDKLKHQSIFYWQKSRKLFLFGVDNENISKCKNYKYKERPLSFNGINF